MTAESDSHDMMVMGIEDEIMRTRGRSTICSILIIIVTVFFCNNGNLSFIFSRGTIDGRNTNS